MNLRWTETKPGGDSTGERCGSTCHFLSKREEIILIGGGGVFDYSYDIYNISKNEFTRKESPFARQYHSSCLYSTHSKSFILLFGGAEKGWKYSSDLFECEILSNSEVWKKMSTKGKTKPCSRRSHSCVISSDQQFMFLFGGSGESRNLNDLWKYDIKKQEWEEIKSSTKLLPSPRINHSCVFFDNKMIIGCGDDDNEYLNDFWEFSFTTLTWKELHFQNQEKIIPRRSQQMIVLKNEKDEVQSILLGTGLYSYSLELSKHEKDDLTSFWILDLSKNIWIKLSTKNCKILWEYTMIQSKNQVLIFYGSYVICPKEMGGSFCDIIRILNISDGYKINENICCLSIEGEVFSWECGQDDSDERIEFLRTIHKEQNEIIDLRDQFRMYIFGSEPVFLSKFLLLL